MKVTSDAITLNTEFFLPNKSAVLCLSLYCGWGWYGIYKVISNK